MIYLTKKSANCDARLVIGGKSASVVTKTFHRIRNTISSFFPGNHLKSQSSAKKLLQKQAV